MYTYLLHLKSNGSLQFVNFHNDIVRVCEHCRKLSSLAESWTKKTWNLFDETVRCKESIISLGCEMERKREGGGMEGERRGKESVTYIPNTTK